MSNSTELTDLAREFLRLSVENDLVTEEETSEQVLGIKGKGTARAAEIGDRREELKDFFRRAPARTPAEQRAKAAVLLVCAMETRDDDEHLIYSLCTDILGVPDDDLGEDPSIIAGEILSRCLL